MSVEVTEDGTILQTEAVVDIDDAPASVLRTILKAAKGSVIGDIEISVRKARIKKEKKVVKLEIPEVTYEAGLTMGSKKVEVIVGADGTLLEKPSWGKAGTDVRTSGAFNNEAETGIMRPSGFLFPADSNGPGWAPGRSGPCRF